MTVGDLPAGFESVSEGRVHMVVRADVRARVLPLLRQWATDRLPSARAVSGGRGGVGAYDLTPTLAVVLRPCRRGGVVSWFNHTLYFGRWRPFQELRVTETLRARGVPTVEILAAAVRRVALGWYRGVVVSREIPAALNLWEYLRQVEPPERARICAVTAAVTRRLHDAGVIHPDLNLQNYLVRCANGPDAVLIIDCDRARVEPVSLRQRQAALARLQRSVRRLDQGGEVVTPECRTALEAIASPEAA